VYSVLIALLAINKIYFVWVIFLIVRDFFMMGIRQTALEHGFSIPVSFLGKLKTFVQMAFLAFLILNPYHSMINGGIAEWVADFWRYPRWMAVEAALLGATLILALFSGYLYYREFIQKYKKHDGDRHNQLEI